MEPIRIHIPVGDGDDLYQVAILVDQLKHDDVQQRVNAFSNLERIGTQIEIFFRHDLFTFVSPCLFLFLCFFCI